ncbi:MAG: toxin-antitoxin system HicB family antitoxin [Pirellulaceae bacterium]
MNEMTTQTTIARDTCQEALQIATELMRQKPDWVTFFRETLGVGGVARRLFTSPEEMKQFEKTEEYAQIQQMVVELRSRPNNATDGSEPTRVITVRMPASLHDALKTEAHERKVSMNKLCITKLLQIVDDGAPMEK